MSKLFNLIRRTWAQTTAITIKKKNAPVIFGDEVKAHSLKRDNHKMVNLKSGGNRFGKQ